MQAVDAHSARCLRNKFPSLRRKLADVTESKVLDTAPRALSLADSRLQRSRLLSRVVSALVQGQSESPLLGFVSEAQNRGAMHTRFHSGLTQCKCRCFAF